MKIQEMRNAVRTDLGASVTDLTDVEVERAVGRAVQDLSRVLPKESVLDVTVVLAVVGEALTSGTAAGKWVTLANKPIRPSTETITNSGGTVTYTRDTDYTMDYANGKVTHISGGAITNAQSLKASYTKSGVNIDLGSLAGTLFKISRVEYEAGSVPGTTLDYSLWGNVLELRAGNTSQSPLTAGRHVWVYYLGAQDAPAATAKGSYPEVLDEVVAKGAGLYCLLSLASKNHLKAMTDLDSARTTLATAEGVNANITAVRASLATTQGLAKTALDKVSAILVDGDTALDQVAVNAVLAKANLAIAVDRTGMLASAEVHLGVIAQLSTDVDTALDQVNTWQDGAANSVRSALTSAVAEAALVDGDIAEAKTALDAAATPLGTVAGMITNLGSDLGTAASDGSTTMSTAAIAQAAATAAITNLSNVATPLDASTGALKSMNLGDTALSGASTDLDVAKSPTLVNAALGRVDAPLDAVTGAQKILSDSLLLIPTTKTSDEISKSRDKSDSAGIALDRVKTITDVADAHLTTAKLATDKIDAIFLANDPVLADVDTALDTMIHQLTDANDSVKKDLTEAISFLAAETNSMLDTADNPVDDAHTNLGLSLNLWVEEVQMIRTAAGVPNAEDYLESGAAVINQVNRGKDVPENYLKFAETALSMAKMYVDRRKDFMEIAKIYLEESAARLRIAEQRISESQRRIEIGNVRVSMGRTFVEEATQRLGLVTQYYNLIQARIAEATNYMDLFKTRMMEGSGYVAEAHGRMEVADFYLEGAKVYVAEVQQLVQAAQTKVEVSKTYIQEGVAQIQLMQTLLSIAQAKAQVGQSFMENGRAKVEIARTWVEDSRARSEAAAVLANALGGMAQVMSQRVQSAQVRAAGAQVAVAQGQAQVQYGLGMLERATRRLAASEAYARVAATRIQAAGTYAQEGQMRIQLILARVEAAKAWVEEARGIIAGAEQYLGTARVYVEEAGQRVNLANGYIAEGKARSEQVSNYLQEVNLLNAQIQGYLNEAQSYQNSAERAEALSTQLQAQSDSRRGEYTGLLAGATAWHGDRGTASPLQPTR